jgi:hypothetical protein
LLWLSGRVSATFGADSARNCVVQFLKKLQLLSDGKLKLDHPSIGGGATTQATESAGKLPKIGGGAKAGVKRGGTGGAKHKQRKVGPLHGRRSAPPNL